MTVKQITQQIQEEYKKKDHGDFVKLLEEAFSKKLHPDEALELAGIARYRAWGLRWEGKFEAARTCFCLALNVFSGCGGADEVHKLKKGIVFCESSLGYPGKAIGILKEMVHTLGELIKSKEYPKNFYPEDEMMRTIFYMSIAYVKNNDLAESAKCLDRASELVGGNNRFRGLILQGKAKLLHRQGKFKEALGVLKHAAEVFRNMENEYKVINIREDVATNLHHLGRYAESVSEMNTVLDYYEQNGKEDHWAYFHRAASLERLKKHKEASQDYSRAVATFEKRRGDIKTDHFRRSYSSPMAVIYERAALNCLKTGEMEDAYRLLQRVKARSFLEMMLNRRSYDFLPPEMTRTLEKIQVEINKLLDKQDSGTGEGVKADLVVRREREADLKRRVEHYVARDRKNISFEPLALSAVQKRLPVGHLALDFLVGESKTVIFAVSNDSAECFEFDVGERELREITDDVNGAVMDCGSTAGDARVLKEDALKWYLNKVTGKFPDRLMKELIPSCETLVIVPHSCLHRFPFCLLITGDGKFLAEEKPVYYLDNIQRARKTSFRSGGSMFVVSNPTKDLSYAGEEAAVIKSFFGAERCITLKRSSARRRSVINGLMKYPMFHFAGHAVIDEDEPEMTRLLLSDGPLRISEFFARNLKSGFVFLNGCQTAKGKILPGDEINSFSRAFHFAGAEEVIVNLWEVSDSHSPLMVRYIYKYFTKNINAEKALHLAQKQAISEGLSPFVWAAFKVIK